MSAIKVAQYINMCVILEYKFTVMKLEKRVWPFGTKHLTLFQVSVKTSKHFLFVEISQLWNENPLRHTTKPKALTCDSGG